MSPEELQIPAGPANQDRIEGDAGQRCFCRQERRGARWEPRADWSPCLLPPSPWIPGLFLGFLRAVGVPVSAVCPQAAAVLHRHGATCLRHEACNTATGMHEAERVSPFELVKRDGRREEYDRSKLARSLLRAGVTPYTAAGTLAQVEPGPDMDTGSLRARVEAELERRQPSAARRYATTRSLIARAAEQSGFGWVCLNPDTVNRLGLRPGDTVWLNDKRTPAPFTIESREDVERGHAWLNPGEMAVMGLGDGARLTAAATYQEVPPGEGR